MNKNIIIYNHDLTCIPRHVIASYKQLAPIYTLHYFDHERAKIFIELHYGEREITAYNACGPWAMKSDLFRLLAANVLGGMYLDAKFLISSPPTPFFPDDTQLVCCEWHHKHIVNGIFSAEAGSAVLRDILERVLSNIEHRTSNNVWAVSGPGAWRDVLYSSSPTHNGQSSLYSLNPGISDFIQIVCRSELFPHYLRTDPSVPTTRNSDAHWSELQKTSSIFNI